MKRSVENWYYNLKLNENWRSYATLKLSYLKIMEVAISTRLETAVGGGVGGCSKFLTI